MDENVGSGLEHGANRAVAGDCNIRETKRENGVLLQESHLIFY